MINSRTLSWAAIISVFAGGLIWAYMAGRHAVFEEFDVCIAVCETPECDGLKTYTCYPCLDKNNRLPGDICRAPHQIWDGKHYTYLAIKNS